MIQPERKNQVFLDDVAATEPGEGFAVWWLGQSGFLIKCRAGHLLLDPYLSDSLTEKYAETDKPHVRMTERVVAPERLSMVDVVTSSHNHTDHLDASTLNPLREANPGLELIMPEANRDFACERLGCDRTWPTGLNDGERVGVHGFELHGVAAAHETVERDELGRCRFLGYVVRFGRWTVYHSGDTILHTGMDETLKSFDLDLALLPINGRRPERRVAGNLSGREAAELASRVGARRVIPCHYDMFEFNTESTGEFEDTCREIGQPCTILQNGGRWVCVSRLRSEPRTMP